MPSLRNLNIEPQRAGLERQRSQANDADADADSDSIVAIVEIQMCLGRMSYSLPQDL